LTERAGELDTAIKELEDQLAQQEREANTAIQVWESKTNELEKELDVAIIQLKEVRATLNLNEHEPLTPTLETLMNEREKAEVEVAKSERDESIERLNAEIDIARSELENLRSTNANYIGIQADLEKSKAEVVIITDLLETERNSHLFEKEQLTGELYDEKARYTEARDEVANLTNEVEEIRSESEDVVNQWTGKFDPSSQVYSLLIIS
jgi:CHAD domain-containing protein